MNVLTIQGLSKAFGGQKIIDNLNMTVPEGSVFGFIGQNGAGKTTTMKMLVNLVRPTAGTIRLFGENKAHARRSLYYRIGSIIEAPAFYENLTAEENLRILAKPSA